MPNINNNSLDDLLNKKSFKIKPIFLELPNYSFYHSPFKNSNDDYNKRFVGRKKIINKLKSFIYETTNNTGTYLVTGYRGMGKTSLVNEALSDLKTKYKATEFFLLGFFCLPLIFISKTTLNELLTPKFYTPFFILFLISVIYLLKKQKNKILKFDLTYFKRNKFIFELTYFFTTLYFTVFYLMIFSFNCFELVSKHDRFWFIILSISLVYFLYDSIKTNRQKGNRHKSKSIKSEIWFILFLGLISIITIYCYLDNIIKTWAICLLYIIVIIITYKSIIKTYYYEQGIYSTKLGRLKTFFNFQQHIAINVNLGKDKLSEKDVLKYITNQLYIKYHKWYHTSFDLKRIINKVILYGLLYFTIVSVYKIGHDKMNQSIANDTFKIARYFPSQAIIDNEKVKKIINKESLTDYIKEIGKNSKTDTINIGYKNISNSKYLNMQFIGKVTNTIDFYFFYYWVKTKKIFFNNASNKTIRYLFPNVPVFWVLFTFIFVVILLRVFPSKNYIFLSHHFALKKIKTLKQQIDASINIDKGLTTPSFYGASWFNFKKSTTYAPLESKDISLKLIEILDDISNIKPLFTKIRFIFIFDELDKIDLHYKTSIYSQKEEEQVNNDRFHVRRKERIANILADMKHFLNSAKAKFIFIAGREMYDAALAGISDRESSLDSIFNDNKIYINSFYTENDDKTLNDITSITEKYLCQFLMPKKFIKDKNILEGDLLNLRTYNTYLLETQKHGEQERKKIISTLSDFVTYLTYRSNGAPKKLSNLIEQYITPVSEKEINRKDKLVVSSNSENLHLKFSYYDQYKFSLTSYLVTPIYLNIGHYMNEFSDKLLVSISYMVDHIFKFHKFSISKRSLTLTPEIVDVNKEPEFRNFLDKLIGFLSTNHLRKIVSGIYEFKFHGKIASEINFISKISELEAAAYNFTLDESLELKRHFNQKLKILKGKSQKIVVDQGYKADHVHSIALIHMTIGDLHFYDQEYGNAIIHFLDAIQELRQKNIVEEMDLYNFVLFVRNKLKLALAFEKNKSFDNALMTYSELTDLILRKRNIPIRKLGLVRFVAKKQDIYTNVCGLFFLNSKFNKEWFKNNLIFSNNYDNTKEIDLQIKSYIDGKFDKNFEIIVIGRPTKELNEKLIDVNDWKKLYPIEDMESFYDFDAKYLAANYADLAINIKKTKKNYDFSTFESIRLFYQPLIAKLHLIEKSSPNKLKNADILRVIEEFEFIIRPLKSNEKRVITAEFYNKIGDILYFKNGTLQKKLKKKLLENFTDNKNILLSPIDATLFYARSLAEIILHDTSNNDKIDIKKFYQEKSNNDYKDVLTNVEENIKALIIEITKLIEDDKFKNTYSFEYLSSISNGIIDLASSLLSFSGKENETFLHYNQDMPVLIKLFYQASTIYEKLGEYRLAKSQLIKIIQILRVEKINTLDLQFINFDNLEQLIIKCIELIYSTYEQAHHTENQKIKSKLDTADNKFITTSINAEVDEIISLYWQVYLKHINESENSLFKKETDIKDLISFISNNITPTSSINKKHNRIIQLSLKIKINKKIQENKLGFKNIFHEIYKPKDSVVLSKFILIDSIGACNEIIKSHYLFGVNYINNNYFILGKAHENMAYWCKIYEVNFKDQEKKEIDILLKNIINSNSLMYINSKHHANLAKQNYDKAKDFHSRGKTLHDFLQNKSYLDDFYNDNLVHFSISLERNAIHEDKAKLKSEDNAALEIQDYYVNHSSEPFSALTN